MAAKPVREYFGKQLLAKYLGEASGGEFEFEGRRVVAMLGRQSSNETISSVQFRDQSLTS